MNEGRIISYCLVTGSTILSVLQNPEKKLFFLPLHHLSDANTRTQAYKTITLVNVNTAIIHKLEITAKKAKHKKIRVRLDKIKAKIRIKQVKITQHKNKKLCCHIGTM